MEAVRSKLVTAQSVAQALQFTLTSVDAGFVNKSALYAEEVEKYDREGVYWIAVDPSLYAPIEQGFVVVRQAEPSPAASAFADFLSSPEAGAVLAASGYALP